MSEKSYQIKTLSITDDDFDSRLYRQSLRLRYSYFVEGCQWELPTKGSHESDQYDTIFAHHIVALEDGEVVGTLRILPTTHEVFGNTYMILDAHRGKLPDLPAGLMNHEIVSDSTWEASRLAISHKVPQKLRSEVTKQLILAAKEKVVSEGGSQMLGLMNPVFRRFFHKLKIACEQFGPTFNLNDGPVCVLMYDF